MPSIQEMQADMQAAQAHGDTALAQHIGNLIQVAQRQQNGAIEGYPDLGPLGNAGAAGVVHFAHQLPFIGDAAITAGRWANDQLEGRKTSWAQANQEAHQTIASAQQQHPIAATVGGIAGGVDTAVIGGEALKAGSGGQAVLKALPRATTLAGRAANVGRMAAAGAVAGAAQGAAQRGGEQLAGGNVGQAPAAAAEGALQGGVTGAVLGPVAGGVATAAAKVAQPLAAKTALALSKVFGESAGDLQAAWATFQSTTGRVPTMAELATLKQRGEIAAAAKDSTPITTTLTQAAEDAARARSDNMQQTFAPQPGPASSGELANAKTAQGDVDYTASRAAPDFKIPTDESAELGGVSPADHLSGEVLPQAGLGKADRVRIAAGLKDGTLSSQDAQLLRSGLSDSLHRSYSPATAGYIKDLDSILGGPGNEEPNAALATARTNFAANAQQEAGAAHGETVLGSQTADNFAAEAASKPNANPNFQAGLPQGARSKLADQAATPAGAESLARRLATDDSLHAKLATALGGDAADAFRRLGQAEAGAADNMAAYRNRTPAAESQDAKDLNTGLRALAATASHGVYQFYHGAKALAGLGMSPQVQEKVAQYLADPKMIAQGVNLLRKAGATSAQMRQLAIQAAQVVGAAGSGAVNSVSEQ